MSSPEQELYPIIRGAQPAGVVHAGKVKTKERATMERLDVGDAFMVDTYTKYTAVRGVRYELKPKKFSVTKVPGQGWQVLRIE